MNSRTPSLNYHIAEHIPDEKTGTTERRDGRFPPKRAQRVKQLPSDVGVTAVQGANGLLKLLGRALDPFKEIPRLRLWA